RTPAGRTGSRAGGRLPMKGGGPKLKEGMVMLQRLRWFPRAQARGSSARPANGSLGPGCRAAAGTSQFCDEHTSAVVQAARTQPLSRLGTLWSGSWASDPGAPFRGTGTQVACAAWTRAVARHTNINNIDIFAPFSSMDACRRQLEWRAQRHDGVGAPVVSFLHQSELRSRLQAGGYDVLHDPDTDLVTV